MPALTCLVCPLSVRAAQPWLLDGYPRTVEQAKALDKGHVRVDMVLSLDVPTSVIVDRIRGTPSHGPHPGETLSDC